MSLTHLERLEAESIHIMREVVAEADNPVMLYSIGKDSAVMLHLAMKAFYPAKPPFPLLHVDTGWKLNTVLMPPLAVQDAMKKNHGQRNAFFPFAMNNTGGIQRIKDRSFGIYTTPANSRVNLFAPFHCRTGPNLISGNTSISKAYPSCHFTCRLKDRL